MMFCVGWILCVFFLSMLIPLLIIYNGIVGIVCFILYFVLRKKSVFTKYTEGYKHVLSSILKYGLIVYGSISLVFTGNQRIIAGNAQFTGIAAGRGVGFTTGLLLLREGLGMRETPIRPHSWH